MTSSRSSSRSGTLSPMDKVTEAVASKVKEAAAKVLGEDHGAAAPRDPRAAPGAPRSRPPQARCRSARQPRARRGGRSRSSASRSRSPASNGPWIPRWSDACLTGSRPDLRGRAPRRAAERVGRDPARHEARVHRAARRPPASSRSRRPASSRRRPFPSWRMPTRCSRGCPAPPRSATRSSSRTSAAWPAPRPPGAKALAVFTAATDAFTERNIGMTDRRIARGLRAGAPAGARPRLVAPGVRLDRLRLPLHRRRRPARARSPSRLRLLELGVDEVCFGDTIGVGVPSQVAVLTGAAVERRDPARPDRLPLPRHARHRPRERPGGTRRRDPLLRQLDRRHGRLSLRPRRRGESRHRGPRVPARRVRVRARRRPRGRPRRRAVHHRRRSASRWPRRSARPAVGTRRPAQRLA